MPLEDEKKRRRLWTYKKKYTSQLPSCAKKKASIYIFFCLYHHDIRGPIGKKREVQRVLDMDI